MIFTYYAYITKKKGITKKCKRKGGQVPIIAEMAKHSSSYQVHGPTFFLLQIPLCEEIANTP